MSMSRLTAEVSELRSIKQAAKISVHSDYGALPFEEGRTCNYFEGFISDDTDKTRVVRFGSSQRRLLSKSMKSRKTVTIQDCQAKLAHQIELY